MVKTARTGLHLVITAGFLLLCSVLLLAACGSGNGTAPDEPVPTATEALAARTDTPAAQAETPTTQTDTPTARVETPTTQTDTPTARVETPTAGTDTPTAGAETPAAAEEVGALAEAGREVFRQECAECHGAEAEGGVGPALIGENTNLPAFGTAQGLYDFIRKGMPLDAPGSLPEHEYLEVLAFLLLENAEVEEDTPLGVEGLDEIDLQ